MKHQIVTCNQIIGHHFWLKAPDEYGYLRNSHRHVFVIRCKFSVEHTDRQIEINDMQNIIEQHFKKAFAAIYDGIDFGNMSCEDIATYCINTFGCDECEVLEDGFGGANVWK